jgi:hypothetical protein
MFDYPAYKVTTGITKAILFICIIKDVLPVLK